MAEKIENSQNNSSLFFLLTKCNQTISALYVFQKFIQELPLTGDTRASYDGQDIDIIYKKYYYAKKAVYTQINSLMRSYIGIMNPPLVTADDKKAVLDALNSMSELFGQIKDDKFISAQILNDIYLKEIPGTNVNLLETFAIQLKSLIRDDITALLTTSAIKNDGTNKIDPKIDDNDVALLVRTAQGHIQESLIAPSTDKTTPKEERDVKKEEIKKAEEEFAGLRSALDFLSNKNNQMVDFINKYVPVQKATDAVTNTVKNMIDSRQWLKTLLGVDISTEVGGKRGKLTIKNLLINRQIQQYSGLDPKSDNLEKMWREKIRKKYGDLPFCDEVRFKMNGVYVKISQEKETIEVAEARNKLIQFYSES